MRVAMMLYAGFQLLDASGPMDVFEAANRLCGARFYEQQIVGPSPGPVTCSNGTAVETTACEQDAQGPFDIVVVPGASALGSVPRHRAPIDWLRRIGHSAGRLASVSNGAFLLARAGLADHRWMTTRSRDAQRLANEHPLVRVTTGMTYLKDGNLYSSDGVSGGIDLALALVKEDLGASVAESIVGSLPKGRAARPSASSSSSVKT